VHWRARDTPRLGFAATRIRDEKSSAVALAGLDAELTAMRL
jgi:hypothetical protein